MCFMGGSLPADNSAAIAQQQQAQREANVNAGRSAIDQSFSQFNQPYYDQQVKAYNDYYKPQIDTQFQDARRALTLNLARSGNLASGAGARELSQLQGKYATDRAQSENDALNYGNTVRSNVETERNRLYQQNLAAADPSSIGSAAQASVGALGVQPTFSPLGNLFASIANSGAIAANAQNGKYGNNNGVFTPSNAATVVS